jgi:hypothetical protein
MLGPVDEFVNDDEPRYYVNGRTPEEWRIDLESAGAGTVCLPKEDSPSGKAET